MKLTNTNKTLFIMKKISFILMTVMAFAMLFTGCKPDNGPNDKDEAKVVATLKQADIIQAAKAAYNAWLDTPEIPTELTVGTTTLTQPQYIYALAKVITDIQAGSKADVKVLSYKMADYPDRDSYDQLEIAVFNGPKNGDETEDLGNIAKRMIAAMSDKGQVPNQILFDRGGNKIAFSTNRAIVCSLRALSEYTTSMPETISTDYLATSATLKGFATQFVQYLEIWENTVAETLSADGGNCSANGTAWENVHFVPIPYSGGYPDGVDQYDPKYQPYHNIEVAGVTYTAAQCWGIALKGILDLVTKEGSTVWATERNPATPAHTLGNGKSLNSPIPSLEEWFIWGNYPWYEKADEGGVVKKAGVPVTEVDVALLVRVFPWHLTRSSQLGMIGNFQVFGEDPAGSLIYEDYLGIICPMREFLIAARFYKYLLENNITENVYDAVKNVKFSYDLYNQEQVPIEIDKKSLELEYGGGTGEVKVITKDEAWTATITGEGVTISPESGSAGETTVTVTMAKNEGGSRTATIVFAIPSGKSRTLTVSQGAAPSPATIKDFAKEYVKLIPIWESTTGTVNYLKGVGAFGDEFDVANAHYIPEETKITVSGIEYNLADVIELAERSYLLLRGMDGNNTTASGAGNFPAVTGTSMSTLLPETHGYIWAESPYNETGSTSAGNVIVGNGGPLRMGDPQTVNGVEKVKIDILDNFAQRHVNWPIPEARAKQIANMCGYSNNRLPGYYGCFSAKRGLVTYAYFFKYLLDNNLDHARDISVDQTFTTYLFGEGIY